MSVSIEEAKTRLDLIISKARVDLYKPIQIAEVLRRSRMERDINPADKSSYQNPSIHWRNEVTERLTGKVSTSSARYQHDVWNANAMPPEILKSLDKENKRTKGAVERYIYLRYAERQRTIAKIISILEAAKSETFKISEMFDLFVADPGIRRSIDKAYEIVTYSLFETVVTGLGTVIKVSVPSTSSELLDEFADLAEILLGLGKGRLQREEPAHIYRVGVTNAADRGLDMWANFGPAIQVKHVTLDSNLANEIVDQVESDLIVLVCRDADAETIQTISKQISWGRRVRGMVNESKLVEWYERCMRGKFSERLAGPLLRRLLDGFKSEFPQIQDDGISRFLKERGYLAQKRYDPWLTDIDLQSGKV